MLWVGAGVELGGTARAIGSFPGTDDWAAPAGREVGSWVVINDACGFDQGCPDHRRWKGRSVMTKLTLSYAFPSPHLPRQIHDEKLPWLFNHWQVKSQMFPVWWLLEFCVGKLNLNAYEPNHVREKTKSEAFEISWHLFLVTTNGFFSLSCGLRGKWCEGKHCAIFWHSNAWLLQNNCFDRGFLIYMYSSGGK